MVVLGGPAEHPEGLFSQDFFAYFFDLKKVGRIGGAEIYKQPCFFFCLPAETTSRTKFNRKGDESTGRVLFSLSLSASLTGRKRKEHTFEILRSKHILLTD